MAVQMHVAHSAMVKGAGVIAVAGRQQHQIAAAERIDDVPNHPNLFLEPDPRVRLMQGAPEGCTGQRQAASL